MNYQILKILALTMLLYSLFSCEKENEIVEIKTITLKDLVEEHGLKDFNTVNLDGVGYKLDNKLSNYQLEKINTSLSINEETIYDQTTKTVLSFNNKLSEKAFVKFSEPEELPIISAKNEFKRKRASYTLILYEAKDFNGRRVTFRNTKYVSGNRGKTVTVDGRPTMPKWFADKASSARFRFTTNHFIKDGWAGFYDNANYKKGLGILNSYNQQWNTNRKFNRRRNDRINGYRVTMMF